MSAPHVARGWWLAAALVIAGALAYANTLHNPFIFDDFGSIAMNPQIRELADLRRVFSPPLESPVAGRPLVNLSLAMNYAVGGLEVRGYHLTNIALHIICALLVFAIARRTFERVVLPAGGASPRGLAFAIALLWTVHPLNSEVVDYVIQRTESMMAVMYLLALYASIRAVDSARPGRWTLLAIAASATGMACKESMATLPVMVVVYDRAFLFGNWIATLRTRWRLYAALAATWLVLAALMIGHPRTSTAGFATTPVSVWTYLLNQTVMITRYLRLAFWPSDLVLYYGWPRQVALADVWPYALFVTAILLITIAVFVWRPRAGFLGTWFFVTLAPASSVVPVGSEVGAERRMYLPLLAVVAAGVVLSNAVSGTMARWIVTERAQRGLRRVAVAVSVAIAVAALLVTRARNAEYSSGVKMARTVLARWPTPVAEHMVGTELAKAGEHEEAIEHLRASAQGYPPARYALGLELLQQGNADQAIDELRRFVQGEPRSPLVPRAHRYLATALADRQRYADAIDEYRMYLQAASKDADAWNRLGVALTSAGRTAEALDAYKSAVDLDPADAIFRLTYASALLARGDVVNGGAQAQEAARLAPQEPRAHELLGRVFEFDGRLEDARREYAAAQALDPNDPVVRRDLERVGGRR